MARQFVELFFVGLAAPKLGKVLGIRAISGLATLAVAVRRLTLGFGLALLVSSQVALFVGLDAIHW